MFRRSHYSARGARHGMGVDSTLLLARFLFWGLCFNDSPPQQSISESQVKNALWAVFTRNRHCISRKLIAYFAFHQTRLSPKRLAGAGVGFVFHNRRSISQKSTLKSVRRSLAFAAAVCANFFPWNKILSEWCIAALGRKITLPPISLDLVGLRWLCDEQPRRQCGADKSISFRTCQQHSQNRQPESSKVEPETAMTIQREQNANARKSRPFAQNVRSLLTWSKNHHHHDCQQPIEHIRPNSPAQALTPQNSFVSFPHFIHKRSYPVIQYLSQTVSYGSQKWQQQQKLWNCSTLSTTKLRLAMNTKEIGKREKSSNSDASLWTKHIISQKRSAALDGFRNYWTGTEGSATIHSITIFWKFFHSVLSLFHNLCFFNLLLIFFLAWKQTIAHLTQTRIVTRLSGHSNLQTQTSGPRSRRRRKLQSLAVGSTQTSHLTVLRVRVSLTL